MLHGGDRMNKQDFSDKIPIHWLHSQAYCEYQIYLEYVKGMEAEPLLKCKKVRKYMLY